MRHGEVLTVFDALRWSHEDYARLLWSSHDVGWRSLLVREFVNHREAQEAVIPATVDQQIVLVLSGPSRIAARNGRRWVGARDFPGKIGLTAPDSPVSLRWQATSSQPLHRLHVHVPGALMDRAVEEVWQGRGVGPPRANALATVDPVLEHVLRALRDAATRGVPDGYAEQAAHFLAVHTLARHAGPPPAPPGPENRRVARAVAVMRERLHEPLTLAEVSAAAGLSSFHFSRVFRAAHGESPMRYLTGMRVEAARRLLEQRRLSVTEVAFACGFSSSTHLTSVFARRLGTTPSAYRDAAR